MVAIWACAALLYSCQNRTASSAAAWRYSFLALLRLAAVSIALKYRLFLPDEGLVSPLVVLGLHADRLRLGLRFDRVVDAHAPFLVNAAFGHRTGEGRTVGEGTGKRLRVSEQSFQLAELVVEAPALGLVAGHGPASIEKFGGAARTDNSRQHIASAHVGTGK